MILITGGAGYIGSHVNKSLAAKEHKTLVVDSLLGGYRKFVRWGSLIVANLANQIALDHIFNTYKIEAVVHLAGSSIVGESSLDPYSYYQNNVVNTLQLLDTLKRFRVSKLVLSSTAAVYGDPQAAILSENLTPQPSNPYGRSKWMIEQMVLDARAAYGLNSWILRYFNAAGADLGGYIGEAHRPETHLIPLILDVAKGVKSHISVAGTDYPTWDGTCIRDYVHVSDLADAHVSAVESLLQGSTGGVVNLGYGCGHSVSEVIAVASKVTGRPIGQVAGPRRVGDPAKLVADATRAAQLLDFRPKYVDLEAMIASAWKWHQTL